ncbi:MAG: MetQ/NlpA family ABC transporter substrate-binding protein [Synergistaceae bacterium]|jgi:D-methionine transport system substrate-binding protein|nr:MetQ/NlpA family ABC transporter substrate-binding protein [Synergistaceae bacterium]
MKKFFILFVLAVTLIGVTEAEAAKIRLGVTSGPHEEIAEVVRKIAGERGLEIEIVTFTDFVLPNAALADKEIDVNAFQHLPYLQNAVKDRGYKIVPVANTVLLPMAAYSRRIESLSGLKDGATVTIPNDPSNGGRALLLAAAQGLIELDPASGILPSVTDITKNDRKLKFIELDAAQIPRALEDTDVAVINTNYAIEAGLAPTRDSLFIESKDSPYVCIIAVREEDRDRPEFKTLIESYHNDEVRKFVDERFKGSLVAGW